MSKPRNWNKIRLRHKRKNQKKFMRKSWNRCRKGEGFTIRMKKNSKTLYEYKKWIKQQLSSAKMGIIQVKDGAFKISLNKKW